MNKYLRESHAAQAAKPSNAEPSTRPKKARGPRVNWLLVLGGLFGAYIFLGPYVLKEELTWSAVMAHRGAISENRYLRETRDEKAAFDAKVAAETAKAQTEPLAARTAVLNALAVKQQDQTVAVQMYQNCLQQAQIGANQAANAAMASNRSDGQGVSYAEISAAFQNALSTAAAACEPLKAQRDQALREAAAAGQQALPPQQPQP